MTTLNKYDENGREFSKRVENTVEKEKLLNMGNFSFSYSVFMILLLQTLKNQGLSGKGLTIFHTTVRTYLNPKHL